ncbi:MAG: radical SAM protein [Methermicoccaceae archaeon]
MNALSMLLKTLWQLKVRHNPVILSHTINAGCNLSCAFCPYSKLRGGEMSTREVKLLLSEAREMGVMVYNVWATEPLMRADLPECLDYAKSLGMTTSMITNGLLLEERVDELVDVVDFLSVSLDGIECYEELRGADVQDVLNGVRAARQRGMGVLLNCVINERNLDELEGLVFLAHELGCTISFEPVAEYEQIPKSTWDVLGIRSYERYERAIDELVELKIKGFPIMNSYTYLNMIKTLKPAFRCHVDELFLHVGLDGKVVCCRERGLELGRVSDGLKSVWQHSRQRRKEISSTCEGCLSFGYAESSMALGGSIEVMRSYGRYL